MTRIKICCISSVEEAALAIRAGAAAIGLVGRMPSGPGVIEDTLIRSISVATPPALGSFLLTSETTADAIISHHHRTLTNTIQLVDAVAPATYAALRKSLPFIKIVQVIHVTGEASFDEALSVAGSVDALLLDSGNPALAVKELGGTGRVHNWAISRRIVEQARIPVFLAGGIGENNVRHAIDEVQPFGVDLCSSVRSNGMLDPQKLLRFFAAVNK